MGKSLIYQFYEKNDKVIKTLIRILFNLVPGLDYQMAEALLDGLIAIGEDNYDNANDEKMSQHDQKIKNIELIITKLGQEFSFLVSLVGELQDFANAQSDEQRALAVQQSKIMDELKRLQPKFENTISSTVTAHLILKRDLPAVPNYQLLELIGAGSQGSIYKACNHSGTLVALKILAVNSQIDENTLNKWKMEFIRLSISLNHPNIAPYTNFDKFYNKNYDCWQWFFEMKYVETYNLENILQQRSLSPEEILKIMRGIIKGVNHAHENGITHRDLKPSNILIMQNSEPLIIDFGLSREIGKTLSLPNGVNEEYFKVEGTIGYMSLQQCQGERPSCSDDYYAIGAILYRILSGRTPYGGRNFEEYKKNVATQELLKLTCFTEETWKLLQILLEKDSEKSAIIDLSQLLIDLESMRHMSKRSKQVFMISVPTHEDQNVSFLSEKVIKKITTRLQRNGSRFETFQVEPKSELNLRGENINIGSTYILPDIPGQFAIINTIGNIRVCQEIPVELNHHQWLQFEADTYFNDEDCKRLATVQKLQRVFLAHTKITESGLMLLISLLNLDFIDISCTALNYQDLIKFVSAGSFDGTLVVKKLSYIEEDATERCIERKDTKKIMQKFKNVKIES